MANIEPRIAAFKKYKEQAIAASNADNIERAEKMYLLAAKEAEEISKMCNSAIIRSKYLLLADDCRNNIKTLKGGTPSGSKTDSGSESSYEEFSFAPEAKSGVTFADVAGLDDVKDEIRTSVLEPLKNPELAKTYGIEPGAKILLYGPPGTGKTFIAKAIAGEVDAAFFSVKCSDLISKYMGESSQKLESLFDSALNNKRAVIFFDEFDSVASKRGDGTDGADAEIARFVATFLALVDGFNSKNEKNEMLLLIAATNRPWALDSAMIRGGRFETHIYIGVPDQEAREFLINKALKDKPKEDDVMISTLAMRLEGFGGADITSMCKGITRRAYGRALKSGKIEKITLADCDAIISARHNGITDEELAKFDRFQRGESVD